MQHELMEIVGLYGVYADAYVLDEANHLVFLSVWGRDTALQELLARLTIPVHEGGLEQFKLRAPDGHSVLVFPGNPERLSKHTGRMPRGNLFGDVAQLWLFDPLIEEPDRVNRRAILLEQPFNDTPEHTHSIWDKTWALIKEVCHLPLLDAWRKPVIEAFVQRGWLQALTNARGLTATRIDLGGETLESVITHLIQSRTLTLDAA